MCGTSAHKLPMIRSLHCSQHLFILIDAHFSKSHLVPYMYYNLTCICRIHLLSFLHTSMVRVGWRLFKLSLRQRWHVPWPLRNRDTPLARPHTGQHSPTAYQRTSHVYCFGLWEEARIPGETSRRQGDHITNSTSQRI